MLEFLHRFKSLMLWSLIPLTTGLSVQHGWGQCTNTSQYPTSSVAISGTGSVVTISTANYAGEYSVITGAAPGQTLRFTSSVSTDFITIRSGTSSGPVLASGTTPLVFSNTYTGTVYAHWNTPGCGSQSVNRTTTVQCTNCPLAAPANDNCSGAVTLTPSATTTCSPTNGTTVGATSSGVAVSPCAGTADDDVWYKFTATSTSHTITVAGSSGFDAVINVRSGACNGTNLSCMDNTLVGQTETLPLTGLTIGSTYLIRVYDYYSSITGTFTICVTTPTPANDNCANAVTLTPGSSCSPTSGTTVGATSSGVTGCAGTPDDDVWYKFTATANNHTVTVAGSGGFDAVVDVRSGACNGTTITCSDVTGGGGTETINLTGLTVGSTYLIRIYDYYTGVTGNFTVCVTVSVPANNDCANATVLTPGATGAACSPTSGTTSGATLSGVSTPCFGTTDDDVWYRFTATAANHNVTVTGNTGLDMVLEVRSGACSGTNVACADATGSGGTETAVLTGLTIGATYLIRVYEYYTGVTGNFTICVTTPFDPCSSIMTLTCGTSTTASLSGSGAGWSQIGCFTGGTSGQEKIYSFTPTVTGTHNLQVTATDNSFIHYFWKAASGGCSSTGWTCINDVSTTGTFLIGTLTAGTTYYILLDDENTAASAHTFQINCPAAVPPCVSTPTAPADGQTGICPNSTVALSWPTASGATSYDVYFGTSPTPSLVTNVSTNSYTTGTLTANTYYWQILPRNASGAATGCTVWSFVVSDNTAPSISCPSNLTYATSACGAIALYATPTGTDNCPGATTTQTAGQASGTIFPVGTTVNTFRVTAANGQSSSCSFTVTVDDIEAPMITCPGSQTLPNTPGQCGAVVTYTTPVGTDNCPGATTAQIAGLASGSLFPVGTTTNTFQVTAANGQTSSCSFTITVNDTEAPSITCPSNITQPNAMNQCGATVTFTTPGGADNCPGASTTQIAGMTSGSLFPVGTSTITFRVTAANGQSTTCAFTVTINDTQPPVLNNCPGNQTASVNSSCQGIMADYRAGVTATDNCGSAGAIQQSPSPGTVFTGTTIVTLSATDAANNTGTCTFTLTISDNTPPSITCTVGTLNPAADVNCQYVLPNLTGFSTASDNCGTPTLSQTPSVGTVLGLGTTILTLRATDANNNSTSCTISVSVTDQTAPSISCPGSQTLNNTPGQCGATATYTTPTGTDNCSGATTTQIAGLASGSLFPVGTTTNTFRVTASNGQSSSCSFTITVNDTEAPTIACPGAQTLNNTPGQCGATATYTTPTGTDNCSGATTAQIAGLASGSLFPVGATTNTFRVTASNGQSSSCSFTITVNDTEAPSIACPGSQTLPNTPGQCGATATYTAPTGTDNCSGATTAQIAGLASGSLFPVGATTNTFRVTASNGQSSSCSFTITVNDTEAPSIACPGSQTLPNTPGQCGATATYTAPTGTDNCPGATTAQIAGLASGSLFPVGTTTNTFRVTASNGQSSSCSFTITVNDTEAPSIACPGSQTLPNTPGQCGATATYTAPTGTDNCPGATTAQIAGLASGSLFPVGATTNTFRVTASNGQSSSCSFTITVNDTEAPSISCPGSQTLNNTPGQCSATATYIVPLGTDNCAASSTSQIAGLASGSSFPVGTTTNTFRVIASNGQSSSCSFTITVNDTEAPTIACPGSQTLPNTPGQCSATATYTAPTGTDNCPGATTTQIAGLASGSLFPVGTTTNTFRVTASNGQSSSCSFTITVNDTEAPSIACPGSQTLPNTPGQCGATATYTAPTGTDNCPGATTAQIAGLASGSLFPVGATTNTFRVTASNGQSSSCSFTITVNDTEAPSISCPGSQTLNNTPGQCSATATYIVPLGTDNCAASSTSQIAGLASGSSFPVGTTTNTFRVTAANGQSSSCSFTITVNDTEAPSISCPGSQTLNNTPGQCGATATYTAPTGTDNCPGATTTQIAGLASGSLFPVGTTTNTFRVTASNGQSSSCSFTITVNDTEAPSIACPGSQTLNNTPGQCGATATYTAPTGTDNCPGATTAQIAGLASGSLFPVGTTTNTFRVTASNGQSSSCSFTITVNDTEAPSIACPGSQTLNNTPGQCGATATYTAPTGTDNCPGATTTQIAGLASGSLFPVGATTNTFRVTASNGQSSSCSFTITVNDTEAPSIACPGSQTLNNTPGVCGATATYTAPTGTDNCPGATTAQIAGLASGSLFPVGTTTNTFRVTASNGQSSSCSFTITVNDTQAPTITCPLKQNLTAQAGVCGATTTYTTPTGSDNCPGVSVTQIGGLASGSLFPVGVTNNIWRATDASGNTATCSFSITVTDNQLPAISCPASISTGTDPGECSAVEVYNTPTASDNCPGVSVIQIGGQASGSAFPVGTTTNVFRATDASGNITTCSFTVVVTDTEFPTLNCPAAIVRSSAFNECGRAISNLGQASASDNCPGLTLTNDSPGYFPVGTTTVTYEVSDAAGHTVSCEQAVTVNDVQGPTISCPTIVVETDAGDCVGTVDYEATASDNCPGVSITYSQASPATFGIGHSVVMAVATDASGHTAQCAIGIQVNPREELCNGVDDDCDDLIDESEGWLRVAKRVAKDALEGDEYGISVDIDGDWAIAGSTRGAYLFQRENGVWQAGVRLHELISVPAGSGFGHSVGIDGGTVAVGAPSDGESGTDAGAVYIFEYDGTTWNLVKKVVSGDADSGDKLGWSASLNGGRLLTGAPGDDESGSESGAGYIFGRNTGGANNWGEVKKLAVVGLGAGDGFGHSVALHGTFAAVGAPYDDDQGTDAGAVYRFGKDQGGVDNWGQTGALLGNPTQAGDHFGWSVAVWGASTLVGAPGSDVQGMDAGAAFAFQNNSQVVMLTNFYVEDGAGYGSGVALDGDYAVVTAPGDDPNGSGSGKGFVYLVAGQLWALVGELADGSPSIGDGLGSAVAMSDRTVMTGSPLDDTGVMDDHGSVLFFEGLCADEQTRPREGVEENGLTVSCYPVPFSASLNVAVNTAAGEEVQVTILNLLGQEVVRLTPQVSTGEQQLFSWPSGRAQAGVYLVRVQAGERIQTQSVVLQRP